MANLVGRGGLCVPYELEKTVVAAPEIAGVFLFRRGHQAIQVADTQTCSDTPEFRLVH